MEVIFENEYGKIIHGDNLDVLETFEDNSVDTCISDFPYAIEFMGNQWDGQRNWNQGTGNHGNFTGTGYDGKKRPEFYTNNKNDMKQFENWCSKRAIELYCVLKPGGYAAIFGYPTTNHRMKCAFEDVGFKIVEEIDWIYGTGMPKSQSIKGLADKAGLSDLSEKFDGYNTNGLKPAHEPITIFQKPLDGTYIQNLEKWNVGAMNIEACRVPFNSIADQEERAAKCNFTSASDGSRGYATSDTLYGSGITPLEQSRQLQNVSGRFPPNVIIDESSAEEIDEQSGISKSTGGSGLATKIGRSRRVYNTFDSDSNADYISNTLGGYGDVGGASRYFPIIKYEAKASGQERTLPNGDRNPHVTIKPVELIKWLVKLLTPKGGYTIDITAGSCTHAVACEELNRDLNYGLRYCDIELMNTAKDPYCNVGKMRVEEVIKRSRKKLF